MIAYGYTAPAKADIHCSPTLEYSAFDLHKEGVEWFLFIYYWVVWILCGEWDFGGLGIF